MSAPENLSKLDRLRARDGDLCWLCGSTIDFAAEPNSKKAPTIEHLDPVSLGGSNDPANLVLCHPGCNGHLGNKTKQEKLAIRAKWQANRDKIRARQRVLAATPIEEGGNKRPQKSAVQQPRLAQRNRLRQALRRWQLAAAGAFATALLALGFAAGLMTSN